MGKPTFLDVDTGIDDALAIILAINSPELEVEGISGVSGNVHVDKVVANTRAVLNILGASIPVYRGAEKPLIRELRTAEWVHGEDGLANTFLGKDFGPRGDGNAVEAIKSFVEEHPGDCILITTGPLTNLALAISVFPEIVDDLEKHYMMGGAFGLSDYGIGNATALAEFNVWQDPEAAKIVLGSKLETYIIGLDVTMDPSSALTLDDAEEIKNMGCRACHLIYRVTKFYIETTGDYLMRLHDPMAVAAAIDTSFFDFLQLPVDVEVCGSLSCGATVADRRPWASKSNRKNIAYRVRGEEFKRFFIERAASMP